MPVRSTMPRTRAIHQGAARTFALAMGALVGGVLVGVPAARAGVVTAAKKSPKTIVAKVVIPKPGTPCPTRAATFPRTSLDCVVVPAGGLTMAVSGHSARSLPLGGAGGSVVHRGESLPHDPHRVESRCARPTG